MISYSVFYLFVSPISLQRRGGRGRAPPGAGFDKLAGAETPPGAGSEYFAGAAAPPGAGSDNLDGANGPAGANPGPRRTLLKCIAFFEEKLKKYTD